MENKNSKNTDLYTCPCCGYKTLSFPSGEFDICKICYWEDENNINPFDSKGANHISLKDAQENFKKFGANHKDDLKYVRKPNSEDVFDAPKDLSNLLKVELIDLIKLFKILRIDQSIILDIYSNRRIENETNFRFISNQLNDFLSYEKIIKFDILFNIDFFRKRPNAIREKEKKLLTLNTEEVKEEINKIKFDFINSLVEKGLS